MQHVESPAPLERMNGIEPHRWDVNKIMESPYTTVSAVGENLCGEALQQPVDTKGLDG